MPSRSATANAAIAIMPRSAIVPRSEIARKRTEIAAPAIRNDAATRDVKRRRAALTDSAVKRRAGGQGDPERLGSAPGGDLALVPGGREWRSIDLGGAAVIRRWAVTAAPRTVASAITTAGLTDTGDILTASPRIRAVRTDILIMVLQVIIKGDTIAAAAITRWPAMPAPRTTASPIIRAALADTADLIIMDSRVITVVRTARLVTATLAAMMADPREIRR